MTPPDLANLPLRLTRDEVLALFRFSKETLSRKRKADPTWLPPSAVQGARQMVFDRDAVLKALGVNQPVAEPDAPAVLKFDPKRFQAIHDRRLRGKR